MARIDPDLTHLPSSARRTLSSSVARKFNAYFEFTAAVPGGPSNRSKLLDEKNGNGKPIFVYSNASMISDLVVLAGLFSEVYEAISVGGSEAFNSRVHKLFERNPAMEFEFKRIVEDGEFWRSGSEPNTLALVPLHEAVPEKLPMIWRTMRNGFAHFHWKYDDLSALEYWKAQGWDTKTPQTAFNLKGRKDPRYTAYIVDAHDGWDPNRLWTLHDLRILVTKFVTLRYHLHRFLNILVNSDNRDVFGNDA
jgi:hypothetical protein